MKRALVFVAIASLFGFAGLAQITGEWTGTIDILPSVALESTTLTLNYTVAGFDLSSISTFSGSGWTSQEFDVSGAIGPVNISGEMDFDPAGPAYKYSKLETSMDFAGLSISGSVVHVVYPYIDDYGYDDEYETCSGSAPQTDSVILFYTMKVSADPFSATVRFADCCTGTEFFDATIDLSGIGLCCGLTYDAELYFTKAGFQYVSFSIDHLFDLCCGISFGASVKFGVDYKTVTVTPSWAGITGCVSVWGDLDANGGYIGGWDLKAWKIGCEFSDCNKLTIVTALDPSWYNSNVEDVFGDNEFEYIKIETCGAACCGGNWSLSAQTFFQETGSLFGITRTDIEATVPVMDALSFSVSAELGLSGMSSLSIGWDFSF